MKRKLINWLLSRYWKEKKEDIDKLYWEYIDELKELFNKRTIREVLWELMFTYDISEPINIRERYIIYSRMNNDEGIMKLLKSKYAKNYMAYFNSSNDNERNILKGRMLEIQDIIATMEVAKEKLDNWEEVERIQSKKIILKKDIQQNILTNS